MMSSDRVFGLCIVVVALVYIASAAHIQIGFLSDPVGSRTFPYVIGVFSIICAGVIFLRPDPEPVWPPLMVFARIGLALAVMYAFAVTLRPLGFLIPAAVASAILSYLISPRLLPAIATGIGLSVGLFVIFKFGLGLGLAPFGRLLTG